MKKMLALLLTALLVFTAFAALAEDIVRGEAGIDTCIFINRHSQASEDAIRSIWGDRVKTKEINKENKEDK